MIMPEHLHRSILWFVTNIHFVNRLETIWVGRRTHTYDQHAGAYPRELEQVPCHHVQPPHRAPRTDLGRQTQCRRRATAYPRELEQVAPCHITLAQQRSPARARARSPATAYSPRTSTQGRPWWL